MSIHRLTPRYLFVFLLAIHVLGCRAKEQTVKDTPPVTAHAPGTPQTSQRPLKLLQAAFRNSYDKARDGVIASMSPLIVIRFSDMFLVRNGHVVAEAKGVPEKYELLRLTAHVPLMVTVELCTYLGNPISGEAKKELAAKQALVHDAIADLGNYHFEPDELDWQTKVLTESDTFLDSSVKSGVSKDTLAAYLGRVTRPMMDLADRAGAVQIDAIHAVLTAWRKQLTGDEWKKLCIIIIGARQARDQYVQTQYFSAVFPDRPNSLFRGENRRVIFIEEPSIDPKDHQFKIEKRVAATLALDEIASTLIFNNPDAMAVDIMANGARHRIAQLDFNPLRQ